MTGLKLTRCRSHVDDGVEGEGVEMGFDSQLFVILKPYGTTAFRESWVVVCSR